MTFIAVVSLAKHWRKTDMRARRSNDVARRMKSLFHSHSRKLDFDRTAFIID
jgi:hypothetical protein